MLMYLTDADLHDYMTKTRKHGLTQSEDGSKSGLIFVKENTSGESNFLLDKSDNSVMRTSAQFRTIFENAGYQVLHDKTQRGMPDELHRIKCFVLKPRQ